MLVVYLLILLTDSNSDGVKAHLLVFFYCYVANYA